MRGPTSRRPFGIGARPVVIGVVWALALASAPAQAQRAACGIVMNGNQGTTAEIGVRAAVWHLDRAAEVLSACDVSVSSDVRPCRTADFHLDRASDTLSQGHVAFVSGGCWHCDPGSRAHAGTLLGAAWRLAAMTRDLNARARLDRTYDNTLVTIESWLQTRYCDVPPPAAEVCGDGVDNDRDGLADCGDPDCAAACDGGPSRCTLTYGWHVDPAVSAAIARGEQCYAVYREEADGRLTYRVNLDQGYPPNPWPDGFRRARGGDCASVIQQLRRSCEL